MPYSITTKDGITIRNIPDNVQPDAQELRARVEKIRAENTAALASTDQQPAPSDPSLVDKLIGGGEAALTLATGATGGALGALGGTIGGLAGAIASGDFGTPEGVRRIEEQAGRGMEALTYIPRTEAGQQQAKAVGEALATTIPLAGLTGEMAAAGRAASAAGQGARAIAAPAAAASLERIRAAAPAIADRVQRTISRNPDRAPTPGTRASGGSAATDIAEQRRQLFDEAGLLPTEGQLTRDPMQLRFENEQMKGEFGQPIRERAAENNERFMKRFEEFVDMTEAEAIDAIDVGRSVEKGLRKEAERAKTAIRAAYTKAEKEGELAGPVTLSSLVDHLNESAPDAVTAPILTTARQRAIQLGIAAEGENGNLVPLETTLKNAERMRQAVGRATNYEPTNIRQSAIIKGAIDSATEEIGGPLYRDARRQRENYAKKFEDRAVISQLLNRKRGSADRQVALEDTLQHTIINGTSEDISHLRATLQTGGQEAKQAWKDLQGATVNWIKDEAFKNPARDERGNPILSPAQLHRAMARLDRSDKLTKVFGKKHAEMLRDVNELAKVAMTAPPGYINASNTASVLLAALTEAGISGSLFGIPVPVMSGIRLLAKMSRDKKLQQRIERSLNPPRQRTQL